MLTVVAEDGQRREDVSLLDDIVREGARRMLAAALEAEVDAYLADLADTSPRCQSNLSDENRFCESLLG